MIPDFIKLDPDDQMMFQATLNSLRDDETNQKNNYQEQKEEIDNKSMEDEDYEDLEEASENESCDDQESSESKSMSNYSVHYKKQTMKEYLNDSDKNQLTKVIKQCMNQEDLEYDDEYDDEMYEPVLKLKIHAEASIDPFNDENPDNDEDANNQNAGREKLQKTDKVQIVSRKKKQMKVESKEFRGNNEMYVPKQQQQDQQQQNKKPRNEITYQQQQQEQNKSKNDNNNTKNYYDKSIPRQNKQVEYVLKKQVDQQPEYEEKKEIQNANKYEKIKKFDLRQNPNYQVEYIEKTVQEDEKESKKQEQQQPEEEKQPYSQPIPKAFEHLSKNRFGKNFQGQGKEHRNPKDKKKYRKHN